ncbi:bifunctional folylpolyglutamate synthase/dihydrofolate synthase [candidate division KSB1 bacterium]|nr:bifunctional folylpolyglutamate synthase/dihydrofolate synthase [candidate division KSB1 bacterium]
MKKIRNSYAIYQQFEKDLNSLIGKIKFSAEINLKLERISHLLELLDNPQHSYPSIHVGGTSGKGSTSTMISMILKEAGYKTGLHISPHLQIFNERHQINNLVVPISRLAALYEKIKPAINKVAVENSFGRPTYFEAQVALAFYLFREEKVDVAVVEVGLGGTLDATNVLPAQVAVLTSVGLDHTAILGDTIEKIATDKAGIIKSGQTVVSGFIQPTVSEIVQQRCGKEGARFLELHRDFDFQKENGGFKITTPKQVYDGLKVGIKGEFQMANAACAVAAVEKLKNFQIPASAIRRGLEKATLPGRMEIIQQQPLVILDGAHNPDKIRGVVHAVCDEYPDKKKIVVLGFKSDKATEDILPILLQDVDELIITAFYVKGLWEPTAPEEIARQVRALFPELPLQIIPDPLDSIKQALKIARTDDLVWVTGSLYLVGDIREYWYPAHELIAKAETGLPGSLVYLKT